MDYGQVVFSPDGSQISAISYERDSAQRRIMLYRGVPGGSPVELIDISEYTPLSEQITSVRIRWSDVGILGSINWHYDF